MKPIQIQVSEPLKRFLLLLVPLSAASGLAGAFIILATGQSHLRIVEGFCLGAPIPLLVLFLLAEL